MRILHTSDWHLGRSFHGSDLLDAQVETLEALVDVVRAENIDVVLVAGDIYDRALPSALAVAALDHVLAELQGAGATVIGISGNHDSAVRIGFGERLMSAAGVTLRGDMRAAGQPVIVPEGDGTSSVAFYPIPYLDPEPARHALDAVDARSHDQLMRVALERARVDANTRGSTRTVAIVHAFVGGGETCDSELALSVGGSAEVSLKSFKGFDYVALGHLHGRQLLGNGRVRYSGSPMPYSFSERNHVKGAWIADLKPDGTLDVQPIDLPVHRPLFQLRGTLEHLLGDSSFRDAERGFIQAMLTDAVLPVDAMAKLRRRFPHAVLLEHSPPERVSNGLSYAERVKGRSDLELSLDFIEHVTGRSANTWERSDLMLALDPAPSLNERAA